MDVKEFFRTCHNGISKQDQLNATATRNQSKIAENLGRIEGIEDTLGTINTRLTDARNFVAYDAETEYDIGTIVLKDNTLYKCVGNSGVFSSDFTPIVYNVSEYNNQIDALKTNIKNQKKITKRLKFTTVTVDGEDYDFVAKKEGMTFSGELAAILNVSQSSVSMTKEQYDGLIANGYSGDVEIDGDGICTKFDPSTSVNQYSQYYVGYRSLSRKYSNGLPEDKLPYGDAKDGSYTVSTAGTRYASLIRWQAKFSLNDDVRSGKKVVLFGKIDTSSGKYSTGILTPLVNKLSSTDGNNVRFQTSSLNYNWNIGSFDFHLDPDTFYTIRVEYRGERVLSGSTRKTTWYVTVTNSETEEVIFETSKVLSTAYDMDVLNSDVVNIGFQEAMTTLTDRSSLKSIDLGETYYLIEGEYNGKKFRYKPSWVEDL